MKPGRELDALVAESLGWRGPFGVREEYMGSVGSPKIEVRYGWAPEFPEAPMDAPDQRWIEQTLPPYSTDIAAAWGLVERLIADGYDHPLIRYDTLRADDATKWTVAVSDDREGWRGDAHTAPHAICLAFLKAKTP